MFSNYAYREEPFSSEPIILVIDGIVTLLITSIIYQNLNFSLQISKVLDLNNTKVDTCIAYTLVIAETYSNLQ